MITVAEIKALCPEAEVYELSPDARYIIVLDKNSVSKDITALLAQYVKDMTGHKAIMLRVLDVEKSVRLLEVKP